MNDLFSSKRVVAVLPGESQESFARLVPAYPPGLSASRDLSAGFALTWRVWKQGQRELVSNAMQAAAKELNAALGGLQQQVECFCGRELGAQAKLNSAIAEIQRLPHSPSALLADLSARLASSGLIRSAGFLTEVSELLTLSVPSLVEAHKAARSRLIPQVASLEVHIERAMCAGLVDGAGAERIRGFLAAAFNQVTSLVDGSFDSVACHARRERFSHDIQTVVRELTEASESTRILNRKLFERVDAAFEIAQRADHDRQFRAESARYNPATPSGAVLALILVGTHLDKYAGMPALNEADTEGLRSLLVRRDLALKTLGDLGSRKAFKIFEQEVSACDDLIRSDPELLRAAIWARQVLTDAFPSVELLAESIRERCALDLKSATRIAEAISTHEAMAVVDELQRQLTQYPAHRRVLLEVLTINPALCETSATLAAYGLHLHGYLEAIAPWNTFGRFNFCTSADQISSLHLIEQRRAEHTGSLCGDGGIPAALCRPEVGVAWRDTSAILLQTPFPAHLAQQAATILIYGLSADGNVIGASGVSAQDVISRVVGTPHGSNSQSSLLRALNELVKARILSRVGDRYYFNADEAIGVCTPLVARVKTVFTIMKPEPALPRAKSNGTHLNGVVSARVIPDSKPPAQLNARVTPELVKALRDLVSAIPEFSSELALLRSWDEFRTKFPRGCSNRTSDKKLWPDIEVWWKRQYEAHTTGVFTAQEISFSQLGPAQQQERKCAMFEAARIDPILDKLKALIDPLDRVLHERTALTDHQSIDGLKGLRAGAKSLHALLIGSRKIPQIIALYESIVAAGRAERVLAVFESMLPTEQSIAGAFSGPKVVAPDDRSAGLDLGGRDTGIAPHISPFTATGKISPIDDSASSNSQGASTPLIFPSGEPEK